MCYTKNIEFFKNVIDKNNCFVITLLFILQQLIIYFPKSLSKYDTLMSLCELVSLITCIFPDFNASD